MTFFMLVMSIFLEMLTYDKLIGCVTVDELVMYKNKRQSFHIMKA